MNEPSAEARFALGWDRLAAEDAKTSEWLERVVRPSLVKKNGGRRALTDEQVREARRRRAAGEFLQDIARDLGVCEQTISKTCSGDRYRGVK